MKKRGWIVSILVILVLVIGGIAYMQITKHDSNTPVTQQTKADSKQTKSSINLVALGDSLTQGVGDQSKNGGYVGIIKDKLASTYDIKVHTSNYGVSGDRSDQILTRLDKSTKFQNNLKSADVIVMTVGGNDLLQLLQKVEFASSTSEITSSLNSGSKTYDKKLNQLLTQVRKYNTDAPIFLFSIYNPFYVYFAHVDSLTDSVHEWNDTSKETLSKYGPAYFVDVDDLMSHGQYTTKAEQAKLAKEDAATNSQNKLTQKVTSKIMSESDKNLNKYISTDDNFHPNHLGYEKMSDKLLSVMKTNNSWLNK